MKIRKAIKTAAIKIWGTYCDATVISAETTMQMHLELK